MVGDDHEGFKATEHFVRSPILGKLYRRSREIAVVLLELGFKFFEERKGVCRGPGKTCKDFDTSVSRGLSSEMLG